MPPIPREAVAFVEQAILQFAELNPVTPIEQVITKLSEYSGLALLQAAVSVKPEVISFVNARVAATPPTVTATELLALQALAMQFDGLMESVPKKQVISRVPV
jgi:hypothetical protein